MNDAPERTPPERPTIQDPASRWWEYIEWQDERLAALEQEMTRVLVVDKCSRCDALEQERDIFQDTVKKLAALEQERDEWMEMSRAPAKLNRDLLEREARLRAAIREKADEIESSGPGCQCYEPVILLKPCWKCRIVVSLRALTKPEGE